VTTIETNTTFHLPHQPTKTSDRFRRRAITQTQWAREQLARQGEAECGVTLGQRMKLLQRFGNFSLAYSTAVQPLLRYFGSESGLIAYRQRWGVAFALGDPLASAEDYGDLLDGFCDRFRAAVFCQVSRPTAELLVERGFYINELGVDTRLLLEQYTLAGKEKEWLRYAHNWVQRRGYRIIEADFQTMDTIEVEQVSEAWRKSRTVKRKEVRFLNRPILLEDEQDVRRFYLMDPEDRIAAYVFLDPIYQEGRIQGYVTAFKRRDPRATQYSEQAIMKAIIEQLKAEGVPELRLGLSPCAWIEDREFPSSWFTRKLFQATFDSQVINRWSYNLQGHADYKRRFRGIEEPTYFASRSKISLWELSALVGLCGIA
jgi:lysylphosphatidylglycerol synthetase-like protein (DUF2156 family)